MALLLPDDGAPVIAIDGEARTGKGTARQLLIKRLPPGWLSLDSGVLYRLLALLGRTRNILDDPSALATLAQTMEFTMDGDDVIYRGINQTAQVRGSEVGALASRIAQFQTVRDALRDKQLSMRRFPGLVTDGRDQCKLFKTQFGFFLKTDPWVKARRHQTWLESRSQPCGDITEHHKMIFERDREDRERRIDPTVPYEGAHIIDTSEMTPEQVADEIYSVSVQRGLTIPT